MTGKRIDTLHEISKLRTGGEWASAHGDFAGLRWIAIQLQELVSEPVHCQLEELASACVMDPERAALLWSRAKESLRS